MRYLLFIILLVATILIAGCVSESPEKVTPVITATVISPRTIPTTHTQEMVKIATVATTKTTTTKTTLARTEAPSKPIASLITVNGTSGKIMRFYTVGTGIVKFTIKYTGNFDNSREGCSKDDRAFIRLAGASIDTSLYNGIATDSYTGTTTFNLVSPGNYSLTTKGCYDWWVDIDNA